MHTSKGLSLVELLVTLSIISIVALIAVPGTSKLRREQQLAGSLSALRGSLAYARQEAIRTGGSVSMTPMRNQWHYGWRIFHDTNNDGIWQASERVLRELAPLGTGVSLTGNTPVQSYIRYTPSGRASLTSGAYQMGTLALCPYDGGKGYQLRLNNAGRVSVVAVDECEAL